jgi:hypothetical protein
MDGMKICKAFDMKDLAQQREHLKQLVMLEDFGDECNGNWLFTWDDGHRCLCRCPACDALILVQYSEFHGETDAYYKDYFPVASREEAVALNETYDGFEIEFNTDLKRIYMTY